VVVHPILGDEGEAAAEENEEKHEEGDLPPVLPPGGDRLDA
jgi:hypothetical protein